MRNLVAISNSLIYKFLRRFEIMNEKPFESKIWRYIRKHRFLFTVLPPVFINSETRVRIRRAETNQKSRVENDASSSIIMDEVC